MRDRHALPARRRARRRRRVDRPARCLGARRRAARRRAGRHRRPGHRRPRPEHGARLAVRRRCCCRSSASSLYFFIGRNFRRDSPRRRKSHGADGRPSPPSRSRRSTAANDGVHRRRRRRDLAATPGAQLEAVGPHTRAASPPLPADTVEIYTAGAEKFPALLDEMATARAVHPPHVPHLGAGRAHRQGHRGPARPAQGRRRGAHPLRLALRASATRRTSSSELAAAGAAVKPCYKCLPQSTTATT